MPCRTTALIVAAGQGLRSGGDAPKQYRSVGGRSVLAHAIDALAGHPAIDAVRVVIGAGQASAYEAAIGTRTLDPPVIGGATRQQSVENGLAMIEGERVLIHDAARPFCPPIVIDRLLAALECASGAVPVLPVTDTIALGGASLGDTVAREALVRVQTPQAFRLSAIRDAHAGWDATKEATDDAQIARAAGLTVATVEGSPMLDKLTFPQDFIDAEAKLGTRLISISASGFDVHAFAPGNYIQLGGVRIGHDCALAGHSDADVALHAITDALLGTIGAGDIGTHFPPSDPQWRGADSARFLAHAAALIERAGGRIDHIDLTVICEAPKIGPHRAAIRARIAAILGLTEGKVSVKATTTEGLGFTGRREGIAAQAIASVRVPECGA